MTATPATVREVLVDLITHPEKRHELGRRGREFAVKWHSASTAGKRFDAIYSELLGALDGGSGLIPSGTDGRVRAAGVE